MQYHQVSPDGADVTGSIYLRRFRTYIEGSLYKGWKAKLQWEMGKGKDTNELAVKDVWL